LPVVQAGPSVEHQERMAVIGSELDHEQPDVADVDQAAQRMAHAGVAGAEGFGGLGGGGPQASRPVTAMPARRRPYVRLTCTMSAVRRSTILAMDSGPASTHLRWGIFSTRPPIRALASASPPHSRTSPSIGWSSSCRGSAAMVWNPPTSRV